MFLPRAGRAARGQERLGRVAVMVVLALASLSGTVTGEYREFDILLPPISKYVHYTSGFLRGPGYIDLSGLKFTALAEAMGPTDDANFDADNAGGGGTDDDMTTPTTNTDTAGSGGSDTTGSGGGDADGGDAVDNNPDDGSVNVPDSSDPNGGGGGGRRSHVRTLLQQQQNNREQLQNQLNHEGLVQTSIAAPFSSRGLSTSSSNLNRKLDGGLEMDATVVDIVIFSLPDRCAKSRTGCDWTALGVGQGLSDGTLRWCCSQEAIDLNLCAQEQVGRLILNSTLFKGTHRFVNVPKQGPMTKQIRYGKVEEQDTAMYTVVFANCNENGRNIQVTGESVWKSNHGYLPGELFGFMYFYAFVMAVYAVLCLWYGLSMIIYKESRIPIEKWIILTTFMGLAEMVLRTADYMIWNADGYRLPFAVYTGILVGVLKRGVSRCLIVMVSLGWGVVRDSLGSTMHTIIVLGAVYIGVSAVRDLMIVFAVQDMEILSEAQENKLFDMVEILTFVIAAVDVIFILWILDALNGTMQYLENMSQMRKLERYLRFRCIFLFSILFAAMWVIFSLVNDYGDDGIVREEQEWVVEAATEVNYLFVLVAVAILWRPNPNAKEYAFVMELPAMSGDGDNELELTGVVPSAMDDDEASPANGGGGGGSNGRNGFGSSPQDKRFQID